jgi:hypothetical protein
MSEDADEPRPTDIMYFAGESDTENRQVVMRRTVGGRLKRSFAMSGMAASFFVRCLKFMPRRYKQQLDTEAKGLPQ